MTTWFPGGHGMREREANQCGGARRVRRVTGSADNDLYQRGKLAALEAGDESVGNPYRPRIVGVEQHDGGRARFDVADEIPLAHALFDQCIDLPQGPLIGPWPDRGS